MKIALLTEGCYPFVTGGVSTWCDQLIRGLDDHDFEIYAVAATSGETPKLEVPDNVSKLEIVPLWDWTPAPPRPSRKARKHFAAIYAPFVDAILDPRADQNEFDRLLREIFEIAQAGDLTALMQTEEAADALFASWRWHNPSAPLSARDAMDATALLDHLLRPLSTPVLDVDVCHAVSNGLPALLALGAKWRHDTPLIMSEHGVYLRERYLACQNIEYSWPVKSMMLGLMRRICWTVYSVCDLVTPVNVYNQRWAVRHGADPDALVTVYNGVDAENYPPAIGEPEVPTIGWVGRIDPLKDLITLIEGFSIVHEQAPLVRLRLFGPVPPGNEWYADLVRARVEELGLTDAVSFDGPVRPATAAYHQSTIVVLTSVSEGLPYTIIEAMMSSRPTLSTSVGGVPEVVGDAGGLVPPRNPDALAAAMLQMLRDPEQCRLYGKLGRARALELFQLDRMLGTFRASYQGLTGEHQLPDEIDLTDTHTGTWAEAAV